jgi:hypothetical protein
MKKIKIAAVVFALLLAAAGYVYFVAWRMPMPWKVIDPHAQGFVEDRFRFEDYRGVKGNKMMQEALRVMFPVGTPKAKVDRILYENQPKFTPETNWGASMEKNNYSRRGKEKNYYGYYYELYPNSINVYVISVFYDGHDRLLEITDYGQPLHNKDFFKGFE